MNMIASEVTLTVSDTLPSATRISTVVGVFTFRRMPVCWKLEKPLKEACRRYSPTGTDVKRYFPSDADFVVRSRFVSRLVRVSETSGRTAPAIAHGPRESGSRRHLRERGKPGNDRDKCSANRKNSHGSHDSFE